MKTETAPSDILEPPGFDRLLPSLDTGCNDIPTGQLSIDRHDALLNGLSDVVALLRSLDREVFDIPSDTKRPDGDTIRLLRLARRLSQELAKQFDDTLIWSRLLRLNGLICGAEIIADTFDVAKGVDQMYAERSALINVTGSALGVAQYLLETERNRDVVKH